MQRAPLALPQMTRPAKMVWWYWALIDEMVAHPELTKKALAERFSISPAALYLVASSDVFQAHLRQRQMENAAHVDNVIRSKMVAVAATTLDVIQEKVERRRDALSMEELTDVADKTLARLGYGQKQSGGVTVNTSGATQVVVPASLADIEAARAALRAVEQSKPAPEITNGNGSYTTETTDPWRAESPRLIQSFGTEFGRADQGQDGRAYRPMSKFIAGISAGKSAPPEPSLDEL